MTSLMISFFAVVLVGVMLAGTVVFFDGGSIPITSDAKRIENRLSSGVHAVALFADSTGSRPQVPSEVFAPSPSGLPIAEVESGLPDLGDGGLRPDETWKIACADGTCEPMTLCIEMPLSDANRKVAQLVADKMAGVASGMCGSSLAMDTTGKAVVGVSF